MNNTPTENTYQLLYKLADSVTYANTSWTTSKEFKVDELVSVAGFEPAQSPPQTE